MSESDEMLTMTISQAAEHLGLSPTAFYDVMNRNLDFFEMVVEGGKTFVRFHKDWQQIKSQGRIKSPRQTANYTIPLRAAASELGVGLAEIYDFINQKYLKAKGAPPQVSEKSLRELKVKLKAQGKLKTT